MSERLNAYDMVFGVGLAEAHFPRIAAALAEAGAEAPDRERFLTLVEVGELMAELVPATAEGTAQIGLLSYHAFHYWRSGRTELKVGEAELRTLLELPAVGEWRLEAPAPGGYFQLPRHLLWVAGMPAEPVDGFFWVSGASPPGRLELLLVLGLREGRPGITVIELAAGPLPESGSWADLQAREVGADFANVLPGGEHLYGLATAGEVLKLVSRLFWREHARG